MSQFHVTEHVIDGAHIREYPRATADDQDAPLVLHVKQYTPRNNPSPRKGDVTIIGGHANGFPKELYEPLWDNLLEELNKHGVRIRAIWIADCAWQGRSGVLNQNKGLLGNDPGWYDYSRDIIHMINKFRMPRPLVAVAHSFGSNALAHASLLHPRLFHSLVLMEAAIAPDTAGPAANGGTPAYASIRRRDVWPSRQHAADSFRKSPFYQSWDPRVFDLWIRYGLQPKSTDPGTPDGPEEGEVTLTTSKHQEIFTFLRPSWPAFDAAGKEIVHPEWFRDVLGAPQIPTTALYPFCRHEPPFTHNRLIHLRPGTFFINGGLSTIVSESEANNRAAITGTGRGGSGGTKNGRVQNVTHPHYGHLLPLENPSFCAQQAATFLKAELAIWAAEETKFEAWARQPNQQKTTASPEWKTYLDRLMKKPKPKM
ncbi:related to host-specific AK-toxin Akt2 [Claviceps purpurea 20.1]|uniref:Related to host-specific AK-toxin Akt2 n=1 Tax=Claviceps purpurea (strain 20.1) TaxID=1111077 RepID=M1VZK1_CLAP2|nr:related to host-specific AK-toxin Akt2 [Claviceps purpurea 20.1]